MICEAALGTSPSEFARNFHTRLRRQGVSQSSSEVCKALCSEAAPAQGAPFIAWATVPYSLQVRDDLFGADCSKTMVWLDCIKEAPVSKLEP